MSGAFVKLLEDASGSSIGRVTSAIEAMVAMSLKTHPVRHLTKAEARRRFDMLTRIFEKLRGELRWGLERTLAHMPKYFQAELDGSTWVPDDRACWMPQDGRPIT